MPNTDKTLMEKGIYFTYDEVLKAYDDCIKNKRNSSNAIHFNINKLENLIQLCNDVNDGSYKIGMSITFIVKFPVYREVFAADFRDRVIHHLVMNELMPLIDKNFIDNSFSCRDGKGVMHGVSTMEKEIREYSNNYTKDLWIAKMDIKSFFMSIRKEHLANMMDEFIVEHYPDNRKKEKLRWLCRLIIMHHSEKLCVRKGDIKAWEKLAKGKSLFDVGETCGLPIGNLTSQIFANFYLTPLDNFITKTLGFIHYGRYVDDFLIISDSKEKLKLAIPYICDFAKRFLYVRIHPNKRYMQHYSKGVRFIGGIIKPYRKYILNRTKGSFYFKMTHEFKQVNPELAERLVCVVNSYLGFFRFYASYRLRKRMLTKMGLLDAWIEAGYIVICKDYKKIKLVKKKLPEYRSVNDIPILQPNE